MGNKFKNEMSSIISMLIIGFVIEAILEDIWQEDDWLKEALVGSTITTMSLVIISIFFRCLYQNYSTKEDVVIEKQASHFCKSLILTELISAICIF